MSSPVMRRQLIKLSLRVVLDVETNFRAGKLNWNLSQI